MQKALLIGVANGKSCIILEGAPAEVRKAFKGETHEKGYDSLEVFESVGGRTRKRDLAKKPKVKSK